MRRGRFPSLVFRLVVCVIAWTSIAMAATGGTGAPVASGASGAAKKLATTSTEKSNARALKPHRVTDLNFNTLINGTERWLIDMHSPWCPACQELRPVWDRLAQRTDRDYEVGEINIQVEVTLARRFNIRQIPTILLVTPEGDVYEYKGAFSVNSLHNFASKGWTKLRAEEGGDGPLLEGCSSPATQCGRTLGSIRTTPRWIKEKFVTARQDFQYGDLALLAAIIGGPVVIGLCFICMLDSYVVHKSKQRGRERRRVG